MLYNKSISDLGLTKTQKEVVIRYFKENKLIHSYVLLATEFRIAIFSQNLKSLENWMTKVENMELKHIRSFINGLKTDYQAVTNAVLYTESNGVVEGISCKIKKIKRTMYGRCGFDLLRRKVLQQYQPY